MLISPRYCVDSETRVLQKRDANLATNGQYEKSDFVFSLSKKFQIQSADMRRLWEGHMKGGRDSLVGQIADHVRERILSGDLKPGERLLETDIARDFGASRSPVREAMRTLLQEGLVEHHPERGIMIRALTRRDADELMSLRAVIDSFAARLAAENIDPEKAAGLRARLDTLLSLAGAHNAEKRIAADIDIHRYIVQCSGHNLLMRLYDLLENQLSLLLKNVRWVDFSHEDLRKQHAALTEAICEGNAAAAAAAALDHSREARRVQMGMTGHGARGVSLTGLGSGGLRRDRVKHVGKPGENDA